MEVRIPKKGDIYRNFKGNLYEVIIIARDSETLEEKVVYKEVNGESAYVRSLPMFVREMVEEIEPALEPPTMIMEFLDLENVTDKIRFLQKSRDQLTENFLEVAAQSLDFVENEGSVIERYDALVRYLKTVERYEKNRFR